MNERGRLPLVVRTLIACIAIATIGTAAAAADERVQFNIAPQDLLTALNEFAQQSDQELLFSSEVAAAKRTAGVTGEFPPSEALRTLLEGTGLGYRVTNENTILIERTDKEPSDHRAETTSSIFSTPLVLAQVQAAQDSQRARESPEDNAQSRQAANVAEDADRLGELTVTGSHLLGVETASPLLVFDRMDFDKAAAATAQQFLATLPQNFGGGHSDDTLFEGLQFDPSFGAAANLRGLGSGATLVLVNGRRSALSGGAEFVDVSAIPLSAVERIEVLTDGASAVYGSDAIGGVVNFIMRKEYQGAETRLRGGATTHGDGDAYQAAQTFGARWNTGDVVLSGQYYRTDTVRSLDRDFSRNAVGPFDLVPNREQSSVYLSARQSLWDRTEISGDVLYADRKARQIVWEQFSAERNEYSTETQQFNSSLGLGIELNGSWELEVTGGLSRNEIDLLVTSPSQFGGLGDLPTVSQYDLWSADAALTGELFRLPSGAARLAIGVSYRDEAHEYRDFFNSPPEKSFTSRAVFGETLIPILGNNDTTGATGLALTLAGRYEDYSAFGTTFDPKVGLRWAPSEALNLRATYGTSFKAPSLFQLNEFNALNALRNIPDASSSTGPTRTVVRFGNNADLQEETATTWTAGLDVAPAAIEGLTAQLTYFDVEYEGRIRPPGVPFATILNDPIYAGLATRRGDIPDPEFNALVADLLSGRQRISQCALPLDPTTRACPEPVTNFNAVLEARLVNLAGTHTRGLDLVVDQEVSTGLGAFDLNVNVSYLFDYEQQVTNVAPLVEFVDTARNPIDLRARASVTWSKWDWTVSAALNYSDSYEDNVGSSLVEIASWTTLDLNVSYNTSQRFNDAWLDDTVLSLAVLNLLDRDPPFFADQSVGLGYDPSNADPLGRTVSLNIVKSW